jgi:hypothetical protein
VSDSTTFGRAVDIVAVVVPSSSAANIAELVVPHLRRDAIYSDWTAKSPKVRDQIAALCAAHGHAFADVAIVDTVAWGEHPVELLVSGRGAVSLAEALLGSRFRPVIVNDSVACSSEIKLCRSVFTKGLSALLLETLVAAKRLGVTDVVADGIGRFVDEGFPRVCELLVGSAVQHGHRRADEAEAMAAFVADTLGTAPMSVACRDVLSAVALEADRHPDAGAESWQTIVSLLEARDVFAHLGTDGSPNS